jgi:hypothetical protein
MTRTTVTFAALVGFAACASACNRSRPNLAAPAQDKSIQLARPGSTPLTEISTHGRKVAAPGRRTLERGLGGTLPPDVSWPQQVPVDVLLVAPAPGFDPAAIDDQVRSVCAALRAQVGVELVAARASTGEVRVLVRYAAGTPPGKAITAVSETWTTAPPPGLGEPSIEAIGRGARTKVALFALADGGRPDATRAVDALVQKVAADVPGVARVHVAGAVRPMLLLELLPRPMLEQAVDLAHLLAGIDGAAAGRIATPFAAPQEAAAAFAAAANMVSVQRRVLPFQQVGSATASAAPFLQILPAVGEPVREARNGHLPVTVLLVDAAQATPDSAMAAAEHAVRAVAARVGATGLTWQPAAVAASYRFVLTVREGRAPELLTELSQRLQAVRELPEVAGMLAVRGLDGVPESVDVDADGDRVWTVWVMAASHDMPVVLKAAGDRLADGPWQARLLPQTFDTGLGWLIGASGSIGIVVVAPDAADLPPALALAGKALRESPAVRDIVTGPTRQPPRSHLAGIRRDPRAEFASLPSMLGLVQRLTVAPQRVGAFGSVGLWLTLPRGDRMQTAPQLPLGWREDDEEVKAWTWADFSRTPDPAPVVDRVRVNGRPALWLIADGHGGPPDGFAMQSFDAIERAVPAHEGLQVLPLVVGQRALGRP